MAKRDPVEALKKFLNRLKTRRIKDHRITYTEFLRADEDVRWEKDGRNSLIYEWQAERSLEDWNGNPNTGEVKYPTPFGSPFWVDTDTVLVSWHFCEDIILTLVWKLTPDFGIRRLTDAEGKRVSQLNRKAAEAGLGLFAKRRRRA